MPDTTKGLQQFFQHDHRTCDEAWSQVEQLLDGGDATGLEEAWARFEAAMERHFQMEEQVLFPAFEARTGVTAGPTAVMRAEHEQMRGLLRQMREGIEQGACEKVLDLGDTLHVLTQQHNMKEEAVLYPMAEQQLQTQWDELRVRCREL